MGARELVGAIADDILFEAGLPADAIMFACLRRGLHALITAGDAQTDTATALIASLDRDVSKQLDSILHAPRFLELEGTWRGLKHLVDQTSFQDNIKVEILNCSKEDVLADFEDAPEVPKSGMYRIAYSAEYGPFGGRPFGAIVSTYTFGADAQDVMCLQKFASVAAMTALPFLAGADPSTLGRKTFDEVERLGPDEDSPALTQWKRFRMTPDAGFVGLVAGRFVARPIHIVAAADGSFSYRESATARDLPYFRGAFALAASITRSFARWRLGSDINGPIGGRARGAISTESLAGPREDAVQVAADYHEARGDMATAATLRAGGFPVDVVLSEGRRRAMAELGVIGFAVDAEAGTYIPETPSCRSSHTQVAPWVDADLDGGLSALLFIGRIVQVVKVLQREQIGTWQEREVLEAEILAHLRTFEAQPGEDASAGCKPLRDVRVSVADVPGNAGWYKLVLALQPSWLIGGLHRWLGIVNKLDKE